jgi:acyl-CoA dehydrogenase
LSTLDFRFEPAQLPPNTAALRREVRAFVREMTTQGLLKPDPRGWARHDPAICEQIGRRGWIGMTWPKRYGGHERSALERYIVNEELLAHGVPLRAHWSADRQNGPLILQYGSEWLKQTFLPLFASGKAGTAIGLSEPDAGSDLAALRTRGTRVEGGWKVNGRKVWTSNAHYAKYLVLLLRTASAEEAGGHGGAQKESRHGGFSRFLVDMSWKGITVRPIINMTGEHDFNEVVFDDLFVPDNMVIGEVGAAWKQLGGELAHERSAPDRWTAALPLLRLLADRAGPRGKGTGTGADRAGRGADRAGRGADRAAKQAIGRLVAQLATLKSMSLSIAGMLEAGQNPSVEASIVKDLGTSYEQEIAQVARVLVPEAERAALGPDDPFNVALRFMLLASPSFSIRGGTREILRNNIARGLGLR